MTAILITMMPDQSSNLIHTFLATFDNLLFGDLVPSCCAASAEDEVSRRPRPPRLPGRGCRGQRQAPGQ